MTAIAIGALAVSAYSASQQSKAAGEAAKAQGQASLATAKEQRINAMLNKIDAERIQKSAGIEADKIRETAIQIRGQQESIQAVSGALVGSGSNQIMTEDTTRRAEADALATVIEGIYGTVNKESASRYMNQAADATILSGGLSSQALLNQGRSQAISTLGSGAMSAYSNYAGRSTAPTTTNMVSTTKVSTPTIAGDASLSNVG